MARTAILCGPASPAKIEGGSEGETARCGDWLTSSSSGLATGSGSTPAPSDRTDGTGERLRLAIADVSLSPEAVAIATVDQGCQSVTVGLASDTRFHSDGPPRRAVGIQRRAARQRGTRARLQPEDGRGRPPRRRRSLPRIRQSRHRHHAQSVSAGDLREPECARVHLREGRLPDVFVRVGWPQPRDALPEAVGLTRDPAAPSRGSGAARWERYGRPT